MRTIPCKKKEKHTDAHTFCISESSDRGSNNRFQFPYVHNDNSAYRMMRKSQTPSLMKFVLEKFRIRSVETQ
jgi:hypothetical protein